MSVPSPIIKKTARTALSEHWLSAVAVSTVLIFVFFIGMLTASLVSVFAKTVGYIIFLGLYLVFAFCPLLLGVLYWFRRLLWSQNDSVVLIFKYFTDKSEYKRAMHLILILTVKFITVAVTVYFPCIIVWILSSEWFYDLIGGSLPVWTSSLWTLNSFLAIIASFALVAVMIRYYLAPYLFVSNDNIHPAEAVNMSTVISKRTGADFFGLVLSFAGWFILSLFVAPLIFTLPYFLMSYIVHCRYAVTAYNSDVDRMNKQNTPFYSVDEI